MGHVKCELQEEGLAEKIYRLQFAVLLKVESHYPTTLLG